MNLRYLSGAIIAIPLLPLMYFQGKRIRSRVPQLPEAKGNEGLYQLNSDEDNCLNIISIGESTIAGVGVETHDEGFTGTFSKEISRLFNTNVKWKVYARSGYTAKRVKEKIIPKITEKEVDLIVIGLGGNDAFTLNRPSRWKAEIRALIDLLQSKYPEATVIFCNMPPIKEFPAFTPLIKFTIGNLVEILGEELRKAVKDCPGVFYFGDKITLNEWMDKYKLVKKKEDFFSDGVHPSKLTYQTWALDIANQTFANNRIKTKLGKSEV